MNAFRCYFRSENGSEPDMLVTGNGEDEQNISTFIRTIDSDGTEHYYDLNGHRMSGEPSVKGVYIHKGKKIVKK